MKRPIEYEDYLHNAMLDGGFNIYDEFWEVRKTAIKKALECSRGNRTNAAKILRINPRTLDKWSVEIRRRESEKAPRHDDRDF